MRNCKDCIHFELCRLLDGAVRKEFEGKFNSLDRLEEIRQKLGERCKSWKSRNLKTYLLTEDPLFLDPQGVICVVEAENAGEAAELCGGEYVTDRRDGTDYEAVYFPKRLFVSCSAQSLEYRKGPIFFMMRKDENKDGFLLYLIERPYLKGVR